MPPIKCACDNPRCDIAMSAVPLRAGSKGTHRVTIFNQKEVLATIWLNEDGKDRVIEGLRHGSQKVL